MAFKKFINFDKSFSFYLVEEKEFGDKHPVDEYFLSIYDLSINVYLSLKWVYWGYEFLNNTSIELNKLDKNSFNFKNIFHSTLEDLSELKINEQNHILLIDNEVISEKQTLEKILNEQYANAFFDENSKIQLKLKINLREFIILSHILFPVFIDNDKWKKDV